ncbi:MAG TPA: TetR/AcrR family transcriptional regulator [Pseudonocardiaceae bacterium]|jgi:TetR/AcrR family transcriptional repressor of lmrAB and yxaGH operons|nr:TetR/AcrR family transcriptional regulator [Pseudonocardiaceae bacterium]
MADDESTRERILRTATGLFQRQGYHATGLNQVLADAKAPKGSLYFHFPRGKEQLAAAAVLAGGAELGDELCVELRAAAGPVAGLAAMGRILGTLLTDSGFRAGCPVATVALDVAADSEPIRTACGQAYGYWGDLLVGRLGAWGVPVERRESLATMVIAALEGALLLARVRQDLTPLSEVTEWLGDLVVGECRAPTGL